MSTFEDYDVTSENYDRQRLAMGANIIGNLLEAKCSANLKDIHLLDAGCGTGNYTKALINYGIGHVTLLDASSGMLKQARSKLSTGVNDATVENIVQANLPDIPFKDGQFDAVMFNLVLHHLDRVPNGETFPDIQKALTEARRVLKQGGVLSITSTKPSWMYLDWFTAMKPSIADRYSNKLPSLSQWQTMARSAGFEKVEVMTLYYKLPQEVYDARRNPVGPTIKSWRDADSFWACATEEDLLDVARQIEEMKASGALEKFVETNDKTGGYYRLLLVVAQ